MAEKIPDGIDDRRLGDLAAKMGVEILELSVERTVGRIPVAGVAQPFGQAHGDAYVVLGESLVSMAVNLAAGEGRHAVAIEINASHSSSATTGFVTGVCTPIHLGRTLTTHEVAITDEHGRRCSSIRITNLIRER
jgi:uncharacterized protein (TIGR00369 family)